MEPDPPAMTCANCDTPNEAGRKFCKECGTALSLPCPSCGSSNAPDSKFCGECGSALVANVGSEGVAAPGEPTSERRLVSVLFADLVSFTTLSERRDAEDVRALLSRYFDAARSVIERHGGLVEKFIGDAVMAVWGTPTAHEDDAERAVRAALELVEAVHVLGREVDADLRARAGVLTGEAATTTTLSEGIVVGDMVNTASRLQSAAEPGAVLVGDATYRAASNAIAFAEAGMLTLKGKEEPVRAWRALRVTAEVGGAGRGPGREPPFVGRNDDLRLVKELLHATEREGKARLVSVTGIGGIGKSRLAWELLKYIDGLSDSIYWHQGRCPAYGEGIAFWALGEMVRMRADIAETDDAPTSRRKLAETVARWVPEPEEQRWIEPRLAHLLGLEERSPGGRDELFSAWRTFFERIASIGPTVMVFEDVQWADPGLLDFIESMLEWSRDRPILVVTLARPELFERRAGWGTAQRRFTAIRLEPIDDEAMTELVAGFVPGLGADDVARIVGRAEGVPLYAVETVRMLADRGMLEARDDGFAVVGDLAEIQIPETLHALIAARLDGLPPQDRTILQHASVLGKSFTAVALSAVAELELDRIQGRLDELVRKEFLVREADPRSPERGQYEFRQGLIREVAYSTLSKADRRRRHLAAAHHLETLEDEELAGVVATHYVEAYLSSPEGPDAQAVAARARDWLGSAADRATSLGSPAQALAYAERALEITPAGSERAALLERAGEAAGLLVKSEQAIACFDEAIAIRRTEGDLDAAARDVARELFSLVETERLEEGRNRAEDILAELGEHESPALVELLSELASIVWSQGDVEEALGHVERALPLAERLGLDELFVQLLGQKATALQSLARHREATILARGATTYADRLSDHKTRAEAYGSLGIMANEEDPRLALSSFQEAARWGRMAGSVFLEALHLSNAIEAALDIGEFDVARQLLSELQSRDLPDLEVSSLALNAASLAAYRGDRAEAERELVAVTDKISEGRYHTSMRTWHSRVVALVRSLAGDDDGTYAAVLETLEPDPTGMNASNAVWSGIHAAIGLRDADKMRAMLAAAEPLHGAWMVQVRATGAAGLAALEGRADEAAEGFRYALEGWHALDVPLDHAWATIDALRALPRDAIPATEVDAAREALTRLGVTPLLEQLQELESSGADSPAGQDVHS